MPDDLYFEPPSRMQLVDKLAHLLRFSNSFVVLSGPVGAGATTVIEQLKVQAVEDNTRILAFVLTENISQGTLLKLLNNAVDEIVNPLEPTSNDLLESLHQKIQRLSELQSNLLIVIDNADYLATQATESLANLQAANLGKMSIIIVGTEKLVNIASNLVRNENLTATLHTEILNPFSRLETQEFIQLRFVRGSDFSKKQLSAIYMQSQGYPGRITQVTTAMIQSGKIKLNNKAAMLPVPHVIGIVVLLVAITTVSSWQYFSDNSLTEEATISQQSQELAIIIDGADPAPLQHLTQQQTTAIVGLTVLEEDIVKQQLKSPMPIEDDLVLQQAKADALKAEIKDLSAKIKSQERQLSAAIEKSQIGQVDLKISQLSDTIKPIIDQDAALVLGASRVAAAVTSEAVAMPLVQKPIAETIRSQNAVDDEVLNTQQFVNAQPLTAQNLLPQEAAIADILNPSISDLYLEPKIISAEPLNAQSTVLSGLGTEQQLAILSAELKSNIDPKLLRGISELNKSAKKTASTQTILVSEVHDLALENIPIKSESTTVIVESSIAVKPKFWPNQQDNESWSNANIIQKWPSSGFTIQLIASQSSDSIKQFIASMPNAEKMYAYPTRLKNKLWNVVIYGQYPSRSVANAAIAKLPIKLQQLKPWVKSISSVKSSIE